mgnify:CR=1 FL=1
MLFACGLSSTCLSFVVFTRVFSNTLYLFVCLQSRVCCQSLCFLPSVFCQHYLLSICHQFACCLFVVSLLFSFCQNLEFKYSSACHLSVICLALFTFCSLSFVVCCLSIYRSVFFRLFPAVYSPISVCLSVFICLFTVDLSVFSLLSFIDCSSSIVYFLFMYLTTVSLSVFCRPFTVMILLHLKICCLSLAFRRSTIFAC